MYLYIVWHIYYSKENKKKKIVPKQLTFFPRHHLSDTEFHLFSYRWHWVDPRSQIIAIYSLCHSCPPKAPDRECKGFDKEALENWRMKHSRTWSGFGKRCLCYKVETLLPFHRRKEIIWDKGKCLPSYISTVLALHTEVTE